jgi:hypothetical protein
VIENLYEMPSYCNRNKGADPIGETINQKPMTKKEYSGWTNYETWLANLWITNDEGIYNWARETIEASETPVTDLECFVTDNMLPESEASFAQDLISAAMSEINWAEIVESLRDE